MPEATKLIGLSKLPSFSVATIPHPLATQPSEALWRHANVLMQELERILAISVPAEQETSKELV
jgi:hypothetical protein